MSMEERTNPYERLKLGLTATAQDVKAAHLNLLIKIHLEMNPLSPKTARLLYETNWACDLLLDPLRRLAVDRQLCVKHNIKELEELERAAVRVAGTSEKGSREGEAQRMRKERLVQISRAMRDRALSYPDGVPPEQSPTDTTVSVTWSLETHPELTTQEAMATLMSLFGSIDTASIVPDPPNASFLTDQKQSTTLVTFRRIADAYGAVYDSEKRSEQRLASLEIGWVNGKVPPIVLWLESNGKLRIYRPIVRMNSDGNRLSPDYSYRMSMA